MASSRRRNARARRASKRSASGWAGPGPAPSGRQNFPMRIRLEARGEPSRAMRYAAPLVAAALTFVGGFVVFATLGKNPLEGIRVFFLSPLKDEYGVAELLLKASPLTLIAVGLAVGFRGNVWNIGAEGQFIAGAIA